MLFKRVIACLAAFSTLSGCTPELAEQRRPTATVDSTASTSVTTTNTVSPKIHRGDAWAIAAPDDWRVLPALRSPIALHLIGDGRTGIPRVDGTLSPLQIGLQVELLEERLSTTTLVAERLIDEAENSPQFRLRNEIARKEIVLADSTDGILLKFKIDKLDRGRLSHYLKLVCATEDERIVIVTGFIVCGKGADNFIEKSGIFDLLSAHVTSLVLNAEKIDTEALKESYEAHNWRIQEAISLTQAANQHLSKNDYAQAINAYADALSISNDVSAAQNGIAWALATANDPTLIDFKQALHHGNLAVTQTGKQDAACIDTLAVAYYNSGDTDAVRWSSESCAAP